MAVMFYCEWCDKKVYKRDAVIIVEDDTFTAPYGDTFVDGGGKHQVETCPDCGEDLEEVE